MKKREQKRDHHHQNYQKKCGIDQLQVHGTLDPGMDGAATHRGSLSGCAGENSSIECQTSNAIYPGIKNEDLPLAQIQIVADSSSLSLYVCFYFVADFINNFSRAIIGGCGQCSAGTGQRAQVALDWAVPWRTRGRGGGRAGRLHDVLFWRG